MVVNPPPIARPDWNLALPCVMELMKVDLPVPGLPMNMYFIMERCWKMDALEQCPRKKMCKIREKKWRVVGAFKCSTLELTKSMSFAESFPLVCFSAL